MADTRYPVIITVKKQEDSMGTKIENMDDLLGRLWGFAEHRVLTVAAGTGIIEAVAQQPDTPEGVAQRLELDSLATGKLMRALNAIGVLTFQNKRYQVNPSLAPYFSPGDSNFLPFLAHSHHLYTQWGATLEGWVRGEAMKPRPRDPSLVKQFGKAMQAMGSYVAKKVVESLDLKEVKRMLDVGGGMGHFSKEIMSAAGPALSATIIDEPTVAALGTEAFSGTPFAQRVAYLAGNYLEVDYGTGYDLALLANVLHQESPENGSILIARSAAALVPGGRLAVVDFAIDEAKHDHLIGALFAINMRSFGDTYCESEIRGWMTDAGLRDTKLIDLGQDRWMIIGDKPI